MINPVDPIANTKCSTAFFKVTTFASGLLGLVICVVMTSYAGFGYDFTDDGFYLIRIAYPYADVPAITQFGLIYHPLYSLLNGDIAALRAFNVTLTFALGAGVSWVVLQQTQQLEHPSRSKVNKIASAFAAFGFGSIALSFFHLWLLTPSYNGLNLQGLMIVVIGLALARRDGVASSLTGWLLIGLGGGLVFVAKPSSAAALATVSLIYIFAAAKFSWRGIALACLVSASFLLVFALVLDGSPTAFLQRLTLGLTKAALIDTGYDPGSLFRLDMFELSGNEADWIWVLFALTSIVVASTLCRNRVLAVGGHTLAISTVALATLILFGLYTPPLWPSYSQAVLLMGPGVGAAFVAALGGLAAIYRGGIRSVVVPSRARASLAGLLAVMPFVASFGTLNNYWFNAPNTALFWALAGLVIIAPLGRSVGASLATAPLAICFQLATVTLIGLGMTYPYRQPVPVRAFGATVEVGPQRSSLVVMEEYAEYINRLRSLMESDGFLVGTPVVDLTGRSPGALYAIGADNIGQAWTMGGYKGSTAAAEAMLLRRSCHELAVAWLLIEPDGPIPIPLTVLQGAGLGFPGAYALVGELSTPTGAGGFANPQKQAVYRPIHPVAETAACQARRAGTARRL